MAASEARVRRRSCLGDAIKNRRKFFSIFHGERERARPRTASPSPPPPRRPRLERKQNLTPASYLSSSSLFPLSLLLSLLNSQRRPAPPPTPQPPPSAKSPPLPLPQQSLPRPRPRSRCPRLSSAAPPRGARSRRPRTSRRPARRAGASGRRCFSK